MMTFSILSMNTNAGAEGGVPKNIHELLTPRGLAYWFIDDGSKLCINQKRYYSFATHSFPLEDQEILVEALRDNFEIDATIQKPPSAPYYMLYIRSCPSGAALF